MARTRRRRRGFRRNTTKWSPNIQEIGTTDIVATPGTFSTDYTLAFNPIQINTAVSQVFTVKNLEVSFYIDKDVPLNNENLEDITAYIMYKPQGMTITSSYNLQHPEYIMAYKFLGSPSLDYVAQVSQSQQYQPVRVRTRLSRTLQTGDSIILFLKGNNTSEGNVSFEFHGLVRWWTKAN